ncbi:MAG: hypothetical protein WA231_05085, partial [Methylocella sp.]
RPLRAARANPEPNWLPLVAKADRSELINRKWYEIVISYPFGTAPVCKDHSTFYSNWTKNSAQKTIFAPCECKILSLVNRERGFAARAQGKRS